MEFEAEAALTADPADVWEAVADLATYPRWLGIVGAAEPSPAHASDPGPGWDVTLLARLGPLVRRKRLRMVRVEHVEHVGRDGDHGGDGGGGAGVVRFERMEHDGRAHGAWVLTASVEAGGGGVGTALSVGLRYDGFGWLPGLDLLLREEAKRAGRRLDALLAAP